MRDCLCDAMAKTGPVPLMQMCADIAYCHHEKYNGTGYPRRIRAEAIPLSARIIAVVDAYDAITSERRYSQARSHTEAVEIIKTDAGTHFDPDIVEAFVRCADEFDAIRGAHCPEHKVALALA